MSAMTAYTKYVILCAPRTGSNYLAGLLHNHPQVISMSELFEKNIIFGKPGRENLKSKLRYKIIRDVFPLFFLKKYENLIRNTHAELAAIQRSLGIEIKHLDCPLKRQDTQSLDKTMVNHQQLKLYFEKTRWKNFFE